MVFVILPKTIWMAIFFAKKPYLTHWPQLAWKFRGIIMRISSDIQLNNLALPPRSAGAAGQNILFTGTETNCQIKINSVKNEQSGDWVCR